MFINLNIYNQVHIAPYEIYKFEMFDINFIKVKIFGFVWIYEFFCLPL